MRDRLESTAGDITSRQRRDGEFVAIAGGEGVDPWSGHGFVRADRAVPTDQNDPPAVSLSPNSGSIDENNSPPNAVATISVDDPDGGTNDLSLSGANADAFQIDGTDLELTVAADFESKSSYSVTVEVNDPSVGSNPDDSQDFTLAVNDVNEAPVIGGLPEADTIGEDSSTAPIGFSVSDPDGDSLDLSAESGNLNLVPDDSIALSGLGTDRTLTVTTSPDSNGTAEIRLIASEELSGGQAQRDTSAFSLAVEPVNDPPEATDELPDDTLAAAGPPLQLTGLQETVFRDPDGDRLSIEASSSVPSVLEAVGRGEGVQSGEGQGGGPAQSPAAILRPQSAGEAEVTLTASDGEQSASAAPFTIVVEDRPSGEEVADEAAQAPVDSTSGEARAEFGETGAEARLQQVQAGGTIRVSFFQGRANNNTSSNSTAGNSTSGSIQAGTDGSSSSESSGGAMANSAMAVDRGTGAADAARPDITKADVMKATGVSKAGATEQFENVSQYRWEIDEGPVQFDSASVRFELADPDILGIGAPREVTVLVDSTEDGEFEEVTTRFDDAGTPSDSADGALVAEGLTSLSTFRLASDSDQNPLGTQVAFEIAGTVRYPTVSDGSVSFADGRALEGVEVEATSGDGTATDTTDADGNFTIDGLGSGDYEVTANVDRGVSNVGIEDAQQVVSGFANGFAGAFQEEVSDVNDSGVPNSTDALRIAFFDLGSITEFEAGSFVVDTSNVTLGSESESDLNIRVAEVGDANLSGGSSDSEGSASTLATTTVSPKSSAQTAAEGSADEATSVAAGETFEVPVRLDRGAEVGSYSLSIEYDAEKATFEGIGSGQGDVLTNGSESGGTLQVGWFDRSGGSALDLQSGSDLVTLRFSAAEGAEGTEFAPEITGGEVNGPDAKAVAAGVETQAVRIATPAPEEFALNGNYPNPASQQATLEMDLPGQAQVTVEVYNTLGQRVQTIKKSMGAGAGQTVQLDASQLSSGQYFYRVEAAIDGNETRETGRLTIVR